MIRSLKDAEPLQPSTQAQSLLSPMACTHKGMLEGHGMLLSL